MRRISRLELAGQNPRSGLKRVRKLVAEVILDMKSNDESVPDPIACRHYSGKSMVRVPTEIHRNLAIRAAESGVSLNRVVSSKQNQET